MPVYRFVCQECGEQFEKKLSFSDSDVKMLCPNGHQHVRRLFAPPAIVFKGSGWYVNDHRKSSAGTEK